MPVKRDESGRRYVQAEVEVPGTPEQVWDAIATGHGISSWFVPTEMDGREGGKIVMHFSPDGTMDAVATITEWNAPHRLTAKGQDVPGGPEIATEWIVETRSGGTCAVRVVHSWFASSDDWDNQFEGHEQGWVAFFRILRLYLEHFAGQPSAMFQVMGESNDQAPAAWGMLVGSLGIASASEGQRVTSSGSAPPVVGRAVRVGAAEHPELLLHLNAPAPGIAHMFALPMGGKTYLPMRMFLYGDRAAEVARREEAQWQQWMASAFGAAQEA
jgi:uncharacterized protein YndB with AHSA1/START domain